MQRRVIRVATFIAIMACMSSVSSAQLSIALNKDSILMGDVPACGGALDSFLLINNGTLVVPSPGVSAINGFRVEAQNDNNILPGESRLMYVYFTGDASVPSYSSRYFLNVRVSGEMASAFIWLLARRLPGKCCVFRIDTITGVPGTQSALRLIQDSVPAKSFMSDVTSTFQIEYDATMFVPSAVAPETINQSQGVVTVRVNLRNENGVLVSIPGTIVLGKSVVGRARIAWISHSDARVTDTTYPGAILLEGVCSDPRSRLFDTFTTLPSIRVVAGGITLGIPPEGGIRKIYISDLLGRIINVHTVTSTSNSTDQFISCSPGLYIISNEFGYSRTAFIP